MRFFQDILVAVDDLPISQDFLGWAATGGVGGLAIFIWRRLENMYQKSVAEHDASLERLEKEHEKYRSRVALDQTRTDELFEELRTRLSATEELLLRTEEALRAAEENAHQCKLKNQELEAKIAALVIRLRLLEDDQYHIGAGQKNSEK